MDRCVVSGCRDGEMDRSGVMSGQTEDYVHGLD